VTSNDGTGRFNIRANVQSSTAHVISLSCLLSILCNRSVGRTVNDR